MQIDDDHLYHGAALIQIAEHPSFTAINSLKTAAGVFRNAYKINNDIAVYLKYATKPVSNFKHYTFTFTRQHLEELEAIEGVSLKVFVALVCVKARQICCLEYVQVLKLVEQRRKSKGDDEEQYVILATLPKGKSFRVYVNEAGSKKYIAGKAITIPRKAYPDQIFE